MAIQKAVVLVDDVADSEMGQDNVDGDGEEDV